MDGKPTGIRARGPGPAKPVTRPSIRPAAQKAFARPKISCQSGQPRAAEARNSTSVSAPSIIRLTEKEAAERLRVSPKTLRNWRSRGERPDFIKIGRSIRYRPVDITKFEQAGWSGWKRGEGR